MIRPVLLAVLVVCSAGAPFVAVQPAAGDLLSDTPTPDGSNESDPASSDDGTEHDSETDEGHGDDGDDDRWYDRWGSDDENRSDDHNRSVGEDTDRNGTDDGTDERSGDGNSTEAGDDGDDQRDARDGSTRDDRWNVSANATSTLNATERALEVAGGTIRVVTDGTPTAGDGDGDTDDGPLASSDTSAPDRGATSAVNDVSLEQSVGQRVGGLLPAATYEGLHGVDGTVEGVLDGSAVLLPFAERNGGTEVDWPSVGNSAGEAPADGNARAGTVDGETGPSPPSVGAVAAPLDRDGASDRGGDGGTDDEDPAGSPVGAGVALFVTVGCLGGSRVAVTQANLLASPGYEGTVASLRRIAGEHLPALPDRVVPPVFGYSRHDSSDPLENDTRAAIYDLVCESPGIYHARLAEETGVAVETVRYHCRILAEEGLVEPRKHRGKRRLYPVTMDDDDPDLAAAIADSATADVLSAIERLEPATLSAVAEHVDCAPSTVAYHLDRLEEDGLVSRERDGGAVEVRLRRSTRSALEGTVADD